MNAVRVASPQYLLLRRKEKYYLYFPSLPLRLSRPVRYCGYAHRHDALIREAAVEARSKMARPHEARRWRALPPLKIAVSFGSHALD